MLLDVVQGDLLFCLDVLTDSNHNARVRAAAFADDHHPTSRATHCTNTRSASPARRAQAAWPFGPEPCFLSLLLSPATRTPPDRCTDYESKYCEHVLWNERHANSRARGHQEIGELVINSNLQCYVSMYRCAD